MGKYRTFSSKSRSNKIARFLNGASVLISERSDHHSRLDPTQPNGYGRNSRKQRESGILPVRSKIEWQEWNRSSNRQQRPFVLLLSCILFFETLSLAQATGLPVIKAEVSTSLSTPVVQPLANLSVSAENQTDFIELTTSNPFYKEDENNQLQTLKLNCTPPSSEEFPPDLFSKEERQNGAIAIHFLVSFYMLYTLLWVCDKYFVPAIECICEDLQIPHNIAGATLMAVSTSAPELFTNVIGTFVTKGDLGVGTIVGSAVFNVLAVGSAIGIGTNFAVKKSQLSPYSQRSKRGVPLEWWSLSRDSGFFLFSIILLVGVLYDGRVYWQEALLMLVVYGFYILAMYYDDGCKGVAERVVDSVGRMLRCGKKPRRKLSVVIKKKVREVEEERAPLIVQESHGASYGTRDAQWGDVEQSGKSTISNSSLYPPLKCQQQQPEVKKAQDGKKVSVVEVLIGARDALDSDSTSSSEDSGISEESVASFKVFATLKGIIAFPIKLVLSWTIPDCSKNKSKFLSYLALLCCIAWIAGLSYVISWMVVIIGETFEIPDSVSGLTFLAAGTSLPEVISSVIVARQGLGSMALSNSVGSNTFDILVCLGLPWLIQASILTAADTNYIEIHSGGLTYSSITLIASFVLLYLIITINGYLLDTKVGIACIILYIIFITFACMLEMNMFFPVNLPPCH